MKTFTAIARKLTLYVVSAILVGSVPMMALAEEVAPVEEDPGYVYDAATGHWSSNKYLYDPVTNTYIENTGSSSTNTVEGGAAGTISDTGSDSTNQIQNAGEATTDATITNDTQVDHNVTGTSDSGDATVQSNTVAGNATSGDAAAIATIMNNLNSSSVLSGQPYAFTQNVYGDVYGDIELAPDLLKAMSQQTAQQPANSTLNYNVLNNNTLNNTVDLGAYSGDASVLDNTRAGSATSGNATAVANVLNIINSVIAANGSFVGTINIYGNLNGDILLNREGSPALITSNAATNPLTNGSLIANNTNLTEIVNNIDLNASTGQANVANNTNAGDATSGDAKTNLVVMNLLNQQVNAKNALLVFVNVLGKWVGIIVDAPTGATAAVLGDDVTSYLIAQTGPQSNNQVTGGTTSDTTIDASTTNKITNNLSVNAHSGDATVAGNTVAGNATSGNATASANVMNMVSSAFHLSDWFGVLFINVFGSWEGSFGIDTENGNKPTVAATPQAPGGAPAPSVPAQVFRFIAHDMWTGAATGSNETQSSDEQMNPAAILAATDTFSSSPTSTETSDTPTTLSVPAAVGILAGLLLGITLAVRLIGFIRGRYANFA